MKQVGRSWSTLRKASSTDGRSWPPRLFISRASSSSLRFSISAVTSPWSPISSLQPLAPRRAALEHQRRVERVGAGVDPLLELFAARLAERGLLQRAVLQDHHVPAEILEELLVALPQALAHHGVEALPVVVDDPPAIAQALLPAFEQRLEDVALVELGVADQRDHAAFGTIRSPAVRAHVILRQRGEQRLRDAEADRAGGEIDVVGVLGARGIGLRALVAAEVLELLARLLAEQVLDGVEVRRGVRLHRDAVLRPQHVEIERRHDGGERGGRRLMAADLDAVLALAQVVGVVDGPARQPEHLAFEFAQDGEVGGGNGLLAHGRPRFHAINAQTAGHWLPIHTSISI